MSPVAVISVVTIALVIFILANIVATTGTKRQPIGDARGLARGNNKDVPWYRAKLAVFEPSSRELFENYSQIPAVDVEAHVIGVVFAHLLLN